MKAVFFSQYYRVGFPVLYAGRDRDRKREKEIKMEI
jgi:hypothetical protein